MGGRCGQKFKCRAVREDLTTPEESQRISRKRPHSIKPLSLTLSAEAGQNEVTSGDTFGG